MFVLNNYVPYAGCYYHKIRFTLSEIKRYKGESTKIAIKEKLLYLMPKNSRQFYVDSSLILLAMVIKEA